MSAAEQEAGSSVLDALDAPLLVPCESPVHDTRGSGPATHYLATRMACPCPSLLWAACGGCVASAASSVTHLRRRHVHSTCRRCQAVTCTTDLAIDVHPIRRET